MHFFQKNLAHWIIGSRRQYFLLNMLRTDRYDRHIFKFFFSIDSQEQNNFKTAWMRQWVYFRQKCSFSKVIKDGSKHYRGSTKLVVDRTGGLYYHNFSFTSMTSLTARFFFYFFSFLNCAFLS